MALYETVGSLIIILLALGVILLISVMIRKLRRKKSVLESLQAANNRKVLINLNRVARFYGEGVKELKYAAQAEVVGGSRKAKLILRAWAEKEDALTGFYHGILDEIEKRINVKGYIDEPIVQHFNIAGHYVTGQVGRIIDVGDRSVPDREQVER